MARLNDAPAPLDPVELLRRKYSRQNKEIARINSTQCIRIRNLENEVSRLLGENLDLREQILRLQNEADAGRSQEVVDHVNFIKANLEAKLLELGTLITTLGDVPNLRKKTSAREAKWVQPSPTQSPDQKNWKNMCTLSEAVGLHDGRLPPIIEDKSYPRRTLEPSEIQNICCDPAAENTESPDIGPPPVSQFINEQPVKIVLLAKSDTNEQDDSEFDNVQSVNLEQRRKRRSSTDPSDQRRASRFEPSRNQSGKEVAQSLKTGAKRKLSTREEEDGASGTKPIEISPDDFKYTRRAIEGQLQPKTLEATEKELSKTQREFVAAKGVNRGKANSATPLNTRKALGPKTTNTDVANSPKKNPKKAPSDDLSFEKEGTSRNNQPKGKLRERRPELLNIKPLPESIVKSTNIDLEPETPAAPDIFSPPESGPSAVRAESRDTPPPTDLDPGMEGQRPSRRARESVSYVQPNLRDKMRRPTKELVDAVTGEGKAQRLSSVKLESEAPTTTRKIKEELEADDAWKSMPSALRMDDYSKSPLVDKMNSRDALPESIATQRHRRRSLMHQVNENELPKSGSSSAISALLGSERKRRQEQNEPGEVRDSLNKAIANLDIYEFTGSSPREPGDPKAPAINVDWHESKTRKSSSNMQDQMAAKPMENLDGEQTTRALISSSRRRQSVVGIGASASDTQTRSHRQAEGPRTSSSHSLLSEGSEAKGERMSARRRSMML